MSRWYDPRALVARWPRLPLAGKAALAAALAWLLVLPMSGLADDYPYYAPFGAVIAVSTTVLGTLRCSAQALASILIGTLLAFAGLWLPLPDVLALALVVALGTMVAGWRRLGPDSGWVPVAAVFVLILGHSDPTGFALAYGGLTAFGAVIGVLVNAALPSPPVLWIDGSGSLRSALAGQLTDLADGLRADDLPSLEQWRERQWEIAPRADELRRMLVELRLSRRANWRTRWWRAESDRQYRRGRSLERLAVVVEDLTLVIMRTEHADREELVLGAASRDQLATTLDRVAALVDQGSDAEPALLRETEEGIEELAGTLAEEYAGALRSAFTAGAIVTGLRQVVAAWSTDSATNPSHHG